MPGIRSSLSVAPVFPPELRNPRPTPSAINSAKASVVMLYPTRPARNANPFSTPEIAVVAPIAIRPAAR